MPAKKHRKKSFHWIVNIDTWLRSNASRSIADFCIDKDPSKRSHPSSWGHVTIAADQGPDGLCAQFFLQNEMRMNASFIWDISHGVNRDILGAINLVGLSTWMHLMVIYFNLGHGPFDSQARFLQLAQSTDTYLKHHARTCPISKLHEDQLIRDFDLVDFVGNRAEELRCRMVDEWSIHNKGDQ